MKNIIFLIDAQKGASGGGKVIYQYSNYINSLKDYSSSIIHVKKKRMGKIFNSLNKRFSGKLKKVQYSGWNFKDLTVKKNYFFSWFNIKVKTKNDLIFDKNKDFVILPEMFAHFATDFFIKEKIPYAIFVQNGYSIFPTNNNAKLNLAYKKCKFILSYSKDIRDCVSFAYPKEKKKIINVKYSIDFRKFKKTKKKNIITFMPRKLRHHSELVISFLKNYLPKNWKIKPLVDLNEKEVYKNLAESKIFLAFSELEGLPLPPVEAAISGNKVIGYTGEGGKEYWKKPIFTEIKSSEIKNFCKEILLNLNLKDFLKKSSNQRKKLSNMFSPREEHNAIIKFLKKI
jgi:hypothetical protein